MAPQIWNVPGITGGKMETEDGQWYDLFYGGQRVFGVGADTPNRAVELFHSRLGTVCPEARPVRV